VQSVLLRHYFFFCLGKNHFIEPVVISHHHQRWCPSWHILKESVGRINFLAPVVYFQILLNMPHQRSRRIWVSTDWPSMDWMTFHKQKIWGHRFSWTGLCQAWVSNISDGISDFPRRALSWSTWILIFLIDQSAIPILCWNIELTS